MKIWLQLRGKKIENRVINDHTVFECLNNMCIYVCINPNSSAPSNNVYNTHKDDYELYKKM